MIRYFPGEISQNLAVEVYLPKNLRNYKVLLNLLTEIIEFYHAQKELIKRSDCIYNNDRPIFELDEEDEQHLKNRDILELKELFELHGHAFTDDIDDVGIRVRDNIYWIKIKDVYKYFIKKDNDERSKVYKTTIWKEHIQLPTMTKLDILTISLTHDTEYEEHIKKGTREEYSPCVFLPGHGDQFLVSRIKSLKDFKKYLRKIRKTILGYSIYEADGAFEPEKRNKGEDIPVEIFTLEKERRKNLLEALKDNNLNIDNIRKVFNDHSEHLEDHLFDLNKKYEQHLKKGKVDDKLRKVFDIKGHSLSTDAKMTNMYDKYWMITDYDNDKEYKKEYVLDASGSELKTYHPYVQIFHEPLEDHLFDLNKKYKQHLKKGKVDNKLRKVFDIKGHSLSTYATMTDMDDKYWMIKDYNNDKEYKKEYVLDASGSELKAYRIDVQIFPPSDDKDYWEIWVCNKKYKIEDTCKELNVSKYIRIIEERTLIISFMTDLKIGPDISLIMPFREKGDNDPRRIASEKVWHTMTLIGEYFVYNLGCRVGIEDEIWITYNPWGFLWKWEKGFTDSISTYPLKLK